MDWTRHTGRGAVRETLDVRSRSDGSGALGEPTRAGRRDGCGVLDAFAGAAINPKPDFGDRSR